MKIYIFILLIVFVLTRHPYESGVGEITIKKILYASSKEREDFIKKVFLLNIREKVKKMVNNIHFKSNIFESRIDLNYTENFGGNAKGEINYFFKDSNGYNFIYGIAEAKLRRLTTYFKSICKRPMPILPLKCRYIKSTPSYEKERFRDYIAERMKKEFVSKLKEIKKTNKDKYIFLKN